MAIDAPQVGSMLIAIEKATNSQLGVLTSTIDVVQDERVGKIGVCLRIDGEGCLGPALRTCVEIWLNVIAVVRLVLTDQSGCAQLG